MNTDVETKIRETADPEKQPFSDGFTGKIPILPVRGMVAFPRMSVPFMISFKSAPMIESVMKTDRIVGLLTIKDPKTEDPVPGQLYEVGTIAKILACQKKRGRKHGPR